MIRRPPICVVRQVSAASPALNFVRLAGSSGRSVRIARAASIGVELTLQWQVAGIRELPLLAAPRQRAVQFGRRRAVTQGQRAEGRTDRITEGE